MLTRNHQRGCPQYSHHNASAIMKIISQRSGQREDLSAEDMDQVLHGLESMAPGISSRRAARQRRERFKLRNQCNDDAESGHQQHARPSPPPQPNNYNFLYTKDHQANLLNFIDFLSEEIQPHKANVQLLPEFPLLEAKYIGSGETMEVYAAKWNGIDVAVKRLNRDQRPNRSTGIPLGRDTAYLEGRNAFYKRTTNVIQEILVMCRVSKVQNHT
jgi:hypothetical protein